MDSATFEQHLRPLMDRAYGYAVRLTGTAEEGADLLQDATVAAFQGRHTFTPGTNFRAWYFRILTNTFYRRGRKARVETVDLEDATDAHLYRHLKESGGPIPEGDPAATVLAGVEAEEVRSALDRLPDEHRTVCLLYFVSEMGYEEIAEVLEIPLGTVRSRLFRGRRLLQASLWELAKEHGWGSGKGTENE